MGNQTGQKWGIRWEWYLVTVWDLLTVQRWDQHSVQSLVRVLVGLLEGDVDGLPLGEPLGDPEGL